jgi:hypothetical protein
MNSLNKLAIRVATCLLTAVAAVAVAHAGEVTIKYKTFPSGPTLDKNIISAGCDTATADDFPDYRFLFWDVQGEIVWTKTTDICVESGDTTATAWYLPDGGSCTTPDSCGCPQTGCVITAYAFSTDHDELLSKGTPIALVTPNSPVVWTAGSPNVITADGPESISAFSALAFPPHKAEPFRYWQDLESSTATAPGIVFHAKQNNESDGLIVAFYGPDPCLSIEEELQSCLDGVGPHGPLNCSGISKQLQMCEKENREVPTE